MSQFVLNTQHWRFRKLTFACIVVSSWLRHHITLTWAWLLHACGFSIIAGESLACSQYLNNARRRTSICRCNNIASFSVSRHSATWSLYSHMKAHMISTAWWQGERSLVLLASSLLFWEKAAACSSPHTYGALTVMLDQTGFMRYKTVLKIFNLW